MSWTVAEARSVACPSCGADVDRPCKGRPTRHHQRRIDAMVAVRRASARARKGKTAPLGPSVVVTGPLYRPKEGPVDYTDVF